MRLGIDFGTCFSSAAYIEGETRNIVKDPFFLYGLTQKSFNQMIAPIIEETISCCRSMIQSTTTPYEEISRILLVGGSCRIPFVQQRLQQEFHCPISAAPDLELVVCLGAALYATQHEVFVVSSTPGACD